MCCFMEVLYTSEGEKFRHTMYNFAFKHLLGNNKQSKFLVFEQVAVTDFLTF